MSFRPCPSYPEYEAALDGTIRRGPFQCRGKGGSMIQHDSRILTHIGRDKAYVLVSDKWVRWTALVEDAWSVEPDVPVSSYPDGRVMTVQEWRTRAA